MLGKIKPNKIKIEASSVCQLNCPCCPTAKGKNLSVIGKGFLKFNDFKNFVDKNTYIKEIELSNYGEIFLNPELLEIIKYAYEKNICLTANNGCNFNNVKEEILEGLVNYKFKSISCSIDGASNEIYKKYRICGNYDMVIENIKKINLFKKKYKSKYPLLKWQFVVFGHNEHEILLAKKMAKKLGMLFFVKFSWDEEFSPVKDQKAIREEFGIGSNQEFEEKYGVSFVSFMCNQMWDQPQINWDGKILGCNCQYLNDYGGNAFTDDLVEVLNSERINYARDMLLGKKEPREDIPCSNCKAYLHMREKNKWLERTDKRYLFSIIRDRMKQKCL